MEKYLVVIERAKSNYSAFSPDVWGCIATGKTVEETVLHIKEALQLHIDAMISDNGDIPKGQGISKHISDGVFKQGEIAEEYFITEVEIAVPQHA
ncbi:MAG: type II toxin-antitoxin system HicB family antitoxin [Mucilaginibacter sp.]